MGAEIKKPSRIVVGEKVQPKDGGEYKVVADVEHLDNTVRVRFEDGTVSNWSVYATVNFIHEVTS